MAARQRLKAASTAAMRAVDAAATFGNDEAVARKRWSAAACSWRVRAPMLLAAPMRKSWEHMGVSLARYGKADN